MRPWAHVHSRKPEGRLIITIDAMDTDQSMERLLEIQRLPEVTMAEIIVYCCDDEPKPPIDETVLQLGE